MKRIVILLALLCAGFSLASAQDLITTRNGEAIQAKVIEVGTSEIKYHKFSNPDGPLYTLSRSDVLTIRYENGEVDTFEEEQDVDNERLSVIPVREGMRYKEYKQYYSTKGYKRSEFDPYKPGLAGFASWILPGLGQCIMGEWDRGLAFFGGCMLLGTVTATRNAEKRVETQNKTDYWSFPLTFTFLGLWIWDVCDAVKVAKIKNLYYRDIYGRSATLDLNIVPYLDHSPAPASAVASGTNLAGGVSLQVNF